MVEELKRRLTCAEGVVPSIWQGVWHENLAYNMFGVYDGWHDAVWHTNPMYMLPCWQRRARGKTGERAVKRGDCSTLTRGEARCRRL